ncbi:MAG: FAD-dependent oxidoreductase, partial [Kiritimatiellae bacterium]|nr:FAD-dependent oxidoreductase [Kiritimatiellia bacterium]
AMPVSYRSLVPKKGENILAAGRCLGAPDSVDTFRLICPCFVTGEAAGTAAALCAKKGLSPRNLPYSELRQALENANVFLG